MRILFVTGDFATPLQATRGMFNVQMARALARRHDVTVIAHVAWRDEWKLRTPGRPVERRRHIDGMDVRHPRYYYTPGMLRTRYGSYLWHSIAGTVRDVLRERPPDVVLSYWLHPDGEVAVRIGALAGIPAVVMSGGSDLLLMTRNAARRRKVEAVLRGADAVVCVSEHLAAEARQSTPTQTPVRVVRRGVDLDRFCPGDRSEARRRLGVRPDRPALVWVGRLDPVKGLDVLLSACARLKHQGSDFGVYLVGGGPLRQALSEQAAQLGLSDRVVMPGVVSHDTLPDWYRAADITVLPSLSEGVPNVLMESIACGTPFVASDVGGVSEIADPLLDRLVPAGDSEALAAALASVLANRGSGSRRFVPQSWDASAEQMESVLVDALRRRGTAPALTSRGSTGVSRP